MPDLDFHAQQALLCFGKPESEVTPKEREKARRALHTYLYGGEPDKEVLMMDPVPPQITEEVYVQIASLIFDKPTDLISLAERNRARRAANEALFGEHAELVGMDRRLPGLTHLGRPTAGPSKELEAIEISEFVSFVEFTSRELTAFCPVTGQPDFYGIGIEFLAAGKSIESKSLKLYLWSFRDEQCFAEDLATTILNDIWPVIEPKSLCVKLTQNVRGGIVIVAQAEKYRERIYAA